MTSTSYHLNTLYKLVKFNEVTGNLINGNKITLKGSSIFAATCIVTITKSWMRPAQPRHGFNEGIYYLQYKDDYYLIEISCTGTPKEELLTDSKFLRYYEYGIPPHVYTSIIASLVSDV